MYRDCTYQEIQAYRELDGVPFDFGTGMIYPSNTMGSEDAYLSMAINEFETEYYYKQYQDNMNALNCPSRQHYEDCHLCCSEECIFAGFLTQKKRPNKYYRKRHNIRKMFRTIHEVEPYEKWWHNGWGACCGWSHYYPAFAYYDDKKQIYVQRSYKASRIKWLKAYSNRRVRRTIHQYGKGHNYKKEFDLWWQYD